MTLQYNISDGTLTPLNQINWMYIDNDNNDNNKILYATKLGFLAPEGTRFKVIIGDNPDTIIMNHYGIYQLNLPDKLIRGFLLEDTVNFGILDVEVPGFIDENIRNNIRK